MWGRMSRRDFHSTTLSGFQPPCFPDLKDRGPGFLVVEQETAADARLLNTCPLSQQNAPAFTAVLKGDRLSEVSSVVGFAKRPVLSHAVAGSRLGTSVAAPEKGEDQGSTVVQNESA